MRTANVLLALAIGALVTSALHARGLAADATPRAVVELFTSQGCASCPPADAKLVELAKDPDLLALTLPVDYWDYLGWTDTLANPAHTARQRGYAQARGDRMVFTPQMVVNGTIACIGSKSEEVSDALDRTSGTRLPVAVSVEVAAGEAEIRVAAGEDAPAEVWLLAIDREEEVAIGRGENSGRHATYANVVRAMTKVGDWTGDAESFRHGLAGRGDFHVVLLQKRADGEPGAILGAGRSDAR
ncbi:DUF1223 domain-containing protein [Salinarimonas ramus]|uniref:DUF1223 domain-containing protein n=1 Tax=Salinarimonas ramus TaxID=690164 RepID=A0A917V3N2_9HYPH|nr:DUF1223 domain-containing protein [Salinarimonas ramus]GGK32667.1 hypothetical protein GCM10011322_19190 [Salinarimonas ramus]